MSAPAAPPRPPRPPPLDAPPDTIIAYQISTLKDLDNPDATTAFRAFDDTISLPARMYENLNAAFKHRLATSNFLHLLPATITAQPAVINESTTPPSATARVTVTSRVDADTQPSQTHLTFHLTHEKLPFHPHTSHWRTTAITKDDSRKDDTS
jgi:hypothetical protein